MQYDHNQFSDNGDGDVPAPERVSLNPAYTNCSTCNFAFSASWDEDSSRWFIPREQMGCATHTGHPQEETAHLRLRREVVPDAENKQLAKNAEETLIRAPTTQKLMFTRTGHMLKRNQV